MVLALAHHAFSGGVADEWQVRPAWKHASDPEFGLHEVVDASQPGSAAKLGTDLPSPTGFGMLLIEGTVTVSLAVSDEDGIHVIFDARPGASDFTVAVTRGTATSTLVIQSPVVVHASRVQWHDVVVQPRVTDGRASMVVEVDGRPVVTTSEIQELHLGRTLITTSDPGTVFLDLHQDRLDRQIREPGWQAPEGELFCREMHVFGVPLFLQYVASPADGAALLVDSWIQRDSGSGRIVLPDMYRTIPLPICEAPRVSRITDFEGLGRLLEPTDELTIVGRRFADPNADSPEALVILVKRPIEGDGSLLRIRVPVLQDFDGLDRPTSFQIIHVQLKDLGWPLPWEGSVEVYVQRLAERCDAYSARRVLTLPTIWQSEPWVVVHTQDVWIADELESWPNGLPEQSWLFEALHAPTGRSTLVQFPVPLAADSNWTEWSDEADPGRWLAQVPVFASPRSGLGGSLMVTINGVERDSHDLAGVLSAAFKAAKIAFDVGKGVLGLGTASDIKGVFSALSDLTGAGVTAVDLAKELGNADLEIDHYGSAVALWKIPERIVLDRSQPIWLTNEDLQNRAAFELHVVPVDAHLITKLTIRVEGVCVNAYPYAATGLPDLVICLRAASGFNDFGQLSLGSGNMKRFMEDSTGSLVWVEPGEFPELTRIEVEGCIPKQFRALSQVLEKRFEEPSPLPFLYIEANVEDQVGYYGRHVGHLFFPDAPRLQPDRQACDARLDLLLESVEGDRSLTLTLRVQMERVPRK